LREWPNNCKQRKEREENKHGNKEALCFVQYNKFIKGIARADSPVISRLEKIVGGGEVKRAESCKTALYVCCT
jgi:hypothetical protein